MLKSIVNSACLMALAALSLGEIAPVMAAENPDCGNCSSCCSNTRACEYRAREVSLTPLQPLQPQVDAPGVLVDPPAVITPVSPPEIIRPLPPRRRSIRGRG